MSEHNEVYRRETANLPEHKQLEILTAGWVSGIQGQLDMGFDPAVVAKGMLAAALTAFADDESRAAFLEDCAADYRGRIARRKQQADRKPN